LSMLGFTFQRAESVGSLLNVDKPLPAGLN